MTDFDPLWVPVLTHYEATPKRRLDRARTAEHLAHIAPYVRQYLIAGTTGDGWEMSDETLADWIDFTQTPGILTQDQTVLFGAFGDTTDAVIARAQMIEQALDAKPLAARYAGLTLCAPVSKTATQGEIADHFHRILAATTSPIAIYQLPQVVHCEIAPETFAALAASDRVTLFKDTSGADKVAASGVSTGSARLLRGAEGDYAAQMKPNGKYDGWLLSTANSLAQQLRAIADKVASGDQQSATTDSKTVSKLVVSLFAAAEGLPHGNPFSNANRAVDHILAYGQGWRNASATIASGPALPEDFLASIEALLNDAGLATNAGYISAKAA
jgi:dihydrodipicolinate synthase/N-acetylneuraminate lyase